MSQFIEMFGSVKNNLQNFPVKSLGEVTDILNGFAFKSAKYVNSGIRIIRIANVQDGYISDEDPQFYPIELMEQFKRFLLSENDILISLTGNVGRVALLSNDFLPAALNQRVACIRPQKGLKRDFLFGYLRFSNFKEDCISNSTGSAQLNLSPIYINDYKILIPPIGIQEKFIEIFHQADKSKFVIQKALVYLNDILSGELRKVA